MRTIIFSLFLFLTGIGVSGQNVIGYNENEIKTYMKENHKEMSYNNVTNSSYKYLKYTNSTESQTLLFFLSPESVCKSVRLICDKSQITQKMKELNTLYKKEGENTWIDKRDGVKYRITSKEEKWAFIVSIETDK